MLNARLDQWLITAAHVQERLLGTEGPEGAHVGLLKQPSEMTGIRLPA